MQYSTIALATLAATGALAAPWGYSVDNSIRVILSDLGETGAQSVFTEGNRETQSPSQFGPFKTVELQLGKGVQNQDYRCQILDSANKPIVVLRGANIDITFSDGDKGPWTFREETEVHHIVCDPTFKKSGVDDTFKKIDSDATFKQTGSDATEIRVVLSNQGTETGSQTVFPEGGRQQKPPVGSTGPFQTVELRLGAGVQTQDLRCQVVDEHHNPIIVLRGKNRDITFSDADKGEWTFETESEVRNIICDPAFVATRV